MAYHINPSTNNPNVCRSKSCALPHYESKEEAQAAKSETLSEKASHAVDKVKEELAKDQAVEQAREDSVIRVSDSAGGKGQGTVSAKVANQIADELESEGREVKVGTSGRSKTEAVQEHIDRDPGPHYVFREEDNVGPKRVTVTNKRPAKQQAKKIARNVSSRVKTFAATAPHHPVVAATKEKLRKLRK